MSVALGMGTAFVHVGCYGFLLGAQERQHCWPHVGTQIPNHPCFYHMAH